MPASQRLKAGIPLSVRLASYWAKYSPTGHPACVVVNVSAFEVPPPGPGFTTVTGALPWVTMSLAGIAAVTWPAFTNVVVRAAPFQWTLEVPTKLLPFTVSVKAAPPAAVLVGASDVRAGTGFAGALMVNVTPFEVPPPGAGVTTVTGALPCGDDVARRNRRRHLARIHKRRRPRGAVPVDLGGPHEIAPVHRQREAGPPGRRARRGERGERRHRLGR